MAMLTVMSEQFRQERERFRLVSSCEQCEHFVDDTEACDLIYPTPPHRQAVFDGAKDGEPVSFCKMFEVRAVEAARMPPEAALAGARGGTATPTSGQD